MGGPAAAVSPPCNEGGMMRRVLQDFLDGLGRRRAPLASGTIADAGGGVVVITLDRDTEDYPEVGRRVTLVPSDA